MVVLQTLYSLVSTGLFLCFRETRGLNKNIRTVSALHCLQIACVEQTLALIPYCCFEQATA